MDHASIKEMLENVIASLEECLDQANEELRRERLAFLVEELKVVVGLLTKKP